MNTKKEKLADLAISESGFVFDPRTGGVFTVNQSGRVVLGLLQDGVSLENIPAELNKVFSQAGERDVKRDLQEFAGMLREYGLLKAKEGGSDD
jgi:sensor domain CHASE-containing protein